MIEQAPLPGQPENLTGPESAGALLRRMREAAGMDVGVLASVLKVPVYKIEALEADRPEQLSNLTFARGLAGAICRTLRTDAAPVLARMPVSVTELRESAASAEQPFRRSGEGPAPMIAGRTSRPWLILVGVLLLGIALLALWPTLPVQLGAPQPDADEEQQEHIDALPSPSEPSLEPENAPAPAAQPAEAQEAPTPAPAGDAASAATVAAPAPARDAAASAPARSASASASAAARNATASAPARARSASVAVRSAPASAPAPALRVAEPAASAPAQFD